MTESIHPLTESIHPLLLTAPRAAEICGCSPRQWRMRNDYGYVPKPILFGKRNYWRYDELVAWVHAGCPKRSDWDYSSPSSEKPRKRGRNSGNSP